MSVMIATERLELDVREVGRRLAELTEEVERLKEELREASAEGETVSPSVPLDAPHPSAAITYSNEEYDALMERLDAPSAPSAVLRRTMSLRPLPEG